VCIAPSLHQLLHSCVSKHSLGDATRARISFQIIIIIIIITTIIKAGKNLRFLIF